MSSAFFSLKGSKIFSKNRLESYSELEKIIKNSMLFFNELVFESGTQATTYGDTIAVNIHGPYKGMDFYSKLRDAYTQNTDKKLPYLMKIQEEGGDRRSTSFSSDAYSFCLSFEGELVKLLENYTPQEIDFIKILIVERDEMKKIVETNINKIRSSMTIAEYHRFLDPVLTEWGFSSICGDVLLRETIFSFIMSNALENNLILDPFHNNILMHTAKYLNQKIEIDKRPAILSEIIPLHLKDYSDLTIEKIIELRNNSSIVAFREKINGITEIAPEVEDWEKEIVGNWYREFLKDMAELAPRSRRSFYLSAIIDLVTTLPVIEPMISLLQSLFGGAKTIHDTAKDYNKIEAYKNSLSHFCLSLSDINSEKS